jgi:23S rRNA pseudouridine1911/1915/1917 synthase
MHKEYSIKTTIEVGIDQGIGCRLDKYIYQLFKHENNVTHSSITHWIKDGQILVNSNIVPKKYHLLNLDLIQIHILNPIKHQDMQPLNVLYRDDHLMIINKPSNLSSHGSRGDHNINLTHIINFENPEQAALPRSGVVNRLDKDTTGLMIVARTMETMELLQDMFRKRDIERRYIAIVHGTFERNAGTIHTYMKKDHKGRRMRISKDEADLEAITHYQVLNTSGCYSLVECKLSTGRTHQIRVHMASIKHPVVADRKYSRSNFSDVEIARQALHAYKLKFIHPITEEELVLEQHMDKDMLHAWNLLNISTND